MTFLGSEGGQGSGISISVPSATVAASMPRGYSDTDREQTIDEMIAFAQSKGGKGNIYGQSAGESQARNLYLKNLEYIRDHPPQSLSQKEEKTNGISIDDILDAIFYASAIASIIPVPPVAIGGRIGLLASSAGRYVSTGNYRGAARDLNRLYNTIDRGSRQYRAYSTRVQPKSIGGKSYSNRTGLKW